MQLAGRPASLSYFLPPTSDFRLPTPIQKYHSSPYPRQTRAPIPIFWHEFEGIVTVSQDN